MALNLHLLRREAATFRSHCWADNTRSAYATHRKAYLVFCRKFHLIPIPASTDTLCCYAAYLARRLKHSSVRQYMNVIRILHLEWGLPNPLVDNFMVTSTLRGIRRQLGDQVSRKAPVTPPMLKDYLTALDLTSPLHASMWGAALLIIFGLLRKSNVMPQSPTAFRAALHLRRQDIKVTPQGIEVTIRWSKTNQFRNRTQSITSPPHSGSPLVPLPGPILSAPAHPRSPPAGPAFTTLQSGRWLPLTAPQFMAHFKSVLQHHGHDTTQLGSHSFRRGGASWAYQTGIPVDLIRQLGDWASNAYTIYTLPNTHMLHQAMMTMARAT